MCRQGAGEQPSGDFIRFFLFCSNCVLHYLVIVMQCCVAVVLATQTAYVVRENYNGTLETARVQII